MIIQALWSMGAGCTPVDGALVGVVSLALAAGGVVAWRTGQRGFTGLQSIVILAILLLLAAVYGLMVLGCAGVDASGKPVPAGSILIGPYPPNAPQPSCQTGSLCEKTGGICGLPRKKCVNTITWDGTATKWRCACECR